MTAEEHRATMEAPDFAEPFEAWRVWRVVQRDGRYSLASAIKPTVWPAGEALVATCLQTSWLRRWWQRRTRGEEHRAAPDAPCDCGIHATELRHLRSYLTDWLAPTAVARVLGRVSLWGTVVECEYGYRASHAYPLRIYVPTDAAWQREHCWDDLAGGLEAYGVPVEPLDARCSEAVRLLEEQQVA